jgi:hypothetical protein
MGLVAERKIPTAGAELPRIEVRLEDVLARAALQPSRRPATEPEPQPESDLHGRPAVVPPVPGGSVIMDLSDLEDLFDRMVRAEARAERAEAELQAAEIHFRYTLGQLAELRRQLRQYDGGTAVGSAVEQEPPAAPELGAAVPPPRMPTAPTVPAPAPPGPAPTPPPAPPPRPPPAPPVSRAPARARTDTGTGSEEPPARKAPIRVPTVPDRVVRRRPPTAAAPAEAEAARIDRLAERLRAIYARLDEYRGQATISPVQEAERLGYLSEYDRALVAACQALDIPTGLEPGEQVSVDARGRLTRALAGAGLDVRAGAPERGRPPLRRAFRPLS